MITDIESKGDPAELSDKGFFKKFFDDVMVRYGKEIQGGELPKVGLNCFQIPDEEDTLLKDVSEKKIEPYRDRVEAIREYKRRRDQKGRPVGAPDLPRQGEVDPRQPDLSHHGRAGGGRHARRDRRRAPDGLRLPVRPLRRAGTGDLRAYGSLSSRPGAPCEGKASDARRGNRQKSNTASRRAKSARSAGPRTPSLNGIGSERPTR